MSSLRIHWIIKGCQLPKGFYLDPFLNRLYYTVVIHRTFKGCPAGTTKKQKKYSLHKTLKSASIRLYLSPNELEAAIHAFIS